MGEWERFESVLASLHEAALDPDGWPKAAGSIDRILGTHGSTLACGGGESEEGYRIYFMWTCLRGQRREDLERLWLETCYPLDERIPRLRRLPFDRLFPVTDLYTEEEKRTSEAYNAIRTHAHAGNGIDVRLYGPDDSRILWQVNDPVDGESWSAAQLDRVRRLLPHVRQTVWVRQTLAAAGALGATLTEMLDATGLGIIQLDGAGGSWRRTTGRATCCGPATACSTGTACCPPARPGTMTNSRSFWAAPCRRPGRRAPAAPWS